MGRRPAVAIVLALVILGAPGRVASQWKLHLDGMTAEAGGAYDGTWLDLRGPELVTAQTFQQWLRITARGSLRDPRILAFQLVARPLLQRGEFLPSAEGVPSGGGGNGLLGAMQLQFFRTSPVSGRVLVQRSRDFRQTRQGGSVDQDVSGWTAEVQDRNPLLPTLFSYRSEDRRTAWRTGPARALLATDERTGTLRMESVNSKTNLLLERLAFEQRNTDTRYVRRMARLVHQQGWGHSSSLRSNIRYVSRAQTSPFRSLTWRETARINQSPSVATELSAGLTGTSTGVANTRQLDVRGTVTKGTGSDFTLSLDGILESWRTGVVQRRFLRMGPRSSYTRQLGWGLRLNASANLLLEAHAQGADGDVFASIVQEPHVLGAAGQFELLRPFADPTSVVMTSKDGATLYEEGFDYRVVDNAPFTVVVALPGGRFEEDGEQVVVDYRYQVAPRVSARSASYGYDVTVAGRGIQLFHRRQAQNEIDDLPPDVLPVLRNYDRRTTGAAVAVSLSRSTLSLRAERRNHTTDRYDFRDDQASAGLTVRLSATFFVIGTARLTRLRGGVQPYDSRQYDYAAEWRPTAPLRIRVHTSSWDWQEGNRGEVFTGEGVLVDWRGGAHTVSLQYDHVTWSGGIDRDENRVSLRFSRQF